MTDHELHIATALGFTAEFTPWAGDFAADYDWDAIRDDYNDALDELAPEGVNWGWTEQGVYCYADVTADVDAVRDRWTEIQEEGLIDFESIAARHDRTTALAAAQSGVEEARRVLDAAMDSRANTVAAAHAAGMTIYRIAKTLGVTQGAVRKMLGL